MWKPEAQKGQETKGVARVEQNQDTFPGEVDLLIFFFTSVENYFLNFIIDILKNQNLCGEGEAENLNWPRAIKNLWWGQLKVDFR